MPTITFLAGEACMSSGISGLMDTFSIANLWNRTLARTEADLFHTQVVSRDGNPVRTQECIELHPHASLADMAPTDILLIPSFLGPDPPPSWQRVLPWIRDQYHGGTPVGAMCTGTFVLAETGLLDGRMATTNWQMGNIFKKRYPRVKLHLEEILTEDAGLFCAGAATATFSLGLHLIERHSSARLTALVAKALLMDPARECQSPYMIYVGPKNHGDTEILAAQTHMEKHFSQSMAMDEVAHKVCLSPRHFKRRFKKATGDSPLAYLQKIRIETAKKKLETTLDTINDITWQIGYEDSSTFRRLFRKHTNLSPREYRDRFMGAGTRRELTRA
ncbi:MAG: helix-turn-helix domain-containing protein [Desulfobacterales bacterium]|nr:helix-turn-helix domain-containing protein [Desulfobacterales bacterium]